MTTTDERRIWERLTAAGLSPAGAAGLMGNLQAESGLRSTRLQDAFQRSLGLSDEAYTAAVDSGTYQDFAADGAGYGLAQWTYHTRKDALLAYARAQGASVGDLDAQIGFLVQELRTGYRAIWDILLAASSVREVSDAVLLHYERPADTSVAVQERRAACGQTLYDRYAGLAPETEEGEVRAVGKILTASVRPSAVGGIAIDTSLPCHARNCTAAMTRSVSYLVIHYTGNAKDTARGNASYFHSTPGIGASAHYFVDENGVYESVAPVSRAWHCGTTGTYYHTLCRNDTSIGIEMCTSGSYKVSERTKRNAAYLAAWWCNALNITADKVDTYVLRHYDVTHKLCPAQMAGSGNAEWSAFRQMIRDILVSGTIDASRAAVTSGSTETRTLPALPFRVTVTASALNVRSGPGTTYSIFADPVGKGEVLTIIDTSVNGWGKLLSGAGWVCLDYVEIGETVAGTVPDADMEEMGASTTVSEAIPAVSVREVSYVVRVTADVLNVRVGPGTTYAISREVSSVRKGEKYTIVETQGNWGRLLSGAGWICLDYTVRA